ncbi:MAG: Maf family protein [Phycisphaerales bacterium]|nr:Maf family protein [Phycisphaerales bacterium]
MALPLQPKSLLLASSSPRRQELLSEAGYRFDIATPPFDEPDAEQICAQPALHTESLAYFKACSVAGNHPKKTILAADTIAFVDHEIIGKPKDRDDARHILKKLSGTEHEVITGVALLQPITSQRLLHHDISVIQVRPLADSAIENYLDTGEWRGKAGAYGIQDHGDAFVERVQGSFTNVVGLPMELLAQMFQQWKQNAVTWDSSSTVSLLDDL